MSPLISVIIPAYNAEQTLLETIKSVQKQTFSDFEIIVINDGSTDRTLQLLQSVEDKRLKVFSSENNGVSVARNRGISQANGEFITFIDADDLWTDDKLELQLAALKQHPEAGVAYSWTYNMSEKGELFHPVEPLFNGNIYAELLVWNFISNGSNVLIRRQAIETVGDFNPIFSYCADWDFYLRLAAIYPFVVVPKHQILYRLSVGSMSSKLETAKEEAFLALEKAFCIVPPELQHLKNQSLANVYQYYAEVYLRDINNNTGDVNQVIQNLLAGLRLYPQNFLNSYTQRLVIKTLLIKLLSPKLASRLLQLISKFRKSSKLQLQ